MGYWKGPKSSHANRWWEQRGDDLYGAVCTALQVLIDRQDYNRLEDLHYQRMYSHRELAGLRGRSYGRKRTQHKLSRNIVKNIIDAATAKIASKRVKPQFLTRGGNFEEKERAKDLTKFALGQHYATKLHEHSRRVFKDGCIAWRGFLKVYRQDGDICAERVLPSEILVDDEECLYGEPRQLFQHKEISKDRLKALFPGHDEMVDNAEIIAAEKDQRITIKDGIADQVSVIEAWHKPSGPDADDGYHAIVCTSGTLYEGEYEHDRFPFATFVWSEPAIGWRGHSLAEQLEPIQLEINMLLRKAQREMKLTGMHIFLPKGSMSNKQGLTNEDGTVWEYVGQPPVVHNANAVAPETWAQITQLVQAAYEDSGISRLTAQSLKPDGLDSGKALREYKDAETERFMDVVQRYEEMLLDATSIMIDLAEEIAEEDDDDDAQTGYKVLGMDKEELVELDWQEVKIEKSKYVMQCYPTNFLPQTPAGQWQQVAEMGKAGMLDQDEMADLLDFPDLKSVTGRRNASYQEIELAINLMLKGTAVQPEPFTNLQRAGQIVQMAYLQARKDGYPEGRLALMRDYLSAVQTMIAQGTPPPPPTQVMPGAAPPPEPPPPGPQDMMGDMQAAPPPGGVGEMPPGLPPGVMQ